jgi:hypothetical protein
VGSRFHLTRSSASSDWNSFVRSRLASPWAWPSCANRPAGGVDTEDDLNRANARWTELSAERRDA